MTSRILLAGLVLLFVAADGTDDATKRDFKRIQGTWAFVVVEETGTKKSQRELEGMEDRLNWTFQGTMLIRNLGDEPVKGKFRLDAKKQPKEIDLFNYAGQGKTVRGIYAFHQGHLFIFVGSANGERPRAFDDPLEPGQVRFRMKPHVVINKDS